jgi:hypothetical protein
MALGLLGGGFDSSRAAQDEFDAWYDTEHIPERLRIQGFINAVRWIGADNPRVSIAIYDLESLDVLRKPEYRAVSPENFSPWSRRILLGKCERLCRFNCVQTAPGDQVAPQGGSGLFLWAANAEPTAGEAFLRWFEGEHRARIAAVPGVLCARAFRTPADAPGSSSHRCVATVHTETPEVCLSDAWIAAWEAEGARSMFRHARDALRLSLRRYGTSA